MQGKNRLFSLTEEEAMQAVMLGGLRRVKSKIAGLKDSHGFGSAGKGAWDMDIEGAMAEMVVAKGLGVYFHPTINTFKAADIGEDIQVRTTRHTGGRLIVRGNDADDEVFVLVINALPKFRVVGWIRGHEAKDPRWLDNAGNKRTPAYFVPQSALRPFPITP